MDRADLCTILRRQVNSRDPRFMQPEFQRILAEETAAARIGEFHYGEHLLSREEDPNLSLEVEQQHLITEPMLPCEMADGPPETTDDLCQCADLTPLTIQGVHLSGSTLEGSDVRLYGASGAWSDIDVMLQLGPVEFPDRDVTRSTMQRNEGIMVIPENVHQKGFFLLYHARLPACHHSERKLFSGHGLRKKILHVVKMKKLEQGRSTYFRFQGPSIESNDSYASADLVTCISFPSWPKAGFASRKRPSRHPNPALVSSLCRTPALLVPVGSAGSPTKEHEWRLSFSRHEYLAHRAMPRILRDCLAVLKTANAVINGPHGAIKGFQLKTSVLWLAELHCEKELERQGFLDCLLMVLQIVDKGAASGRLDCYFWKEINLLAGRSQTELRGLKSEVQLLKKHLETALRVLVALFVWQRSDVQDERLPKRNLSDMLEFMFPAKLRDPKAKKGLYPACYSPPDTWMHANFAMLLSKRVPVKRLYARVLHKMEMGEEESRERETKPISWTDEC